MVRTWERSPVIEDRDGALVVRDDLLEGGSKSRFLPFLLEGAGEVVYGGPFCGGAPLALAVVGRELGIRVTLFYAKRKILHPRQRRCLSHGATIYQVPHGYMSNVQAKARTYAAAVGAKFLSLGFDVPAANDPFIAVMRGVQKRTGSPDQVWCATGSGMLARCLGHAFPDSEVVGVAVGLKSRHSEQSMPPNVRIVESSYDFAIETRAACPFPSDRNYDRKAWEIMLQQRRGSCLFWNVLGPTE
jgi:hypothetical protein